MHFAPENCKRHIFISLWIMWLWLTSCRRAATTICPRPSPPPWAPKCGRADGNAAAVSHGHYVPRWPLQPPRALRLCWVKRPGDLDLLTLKVVRVTCDVGYLCASFGLHRPLCSQPRPDVCEDRQADVRQKHRLMPPPIRGWGVI